MVFGHIRELIGRIILLITCIYLYATGTDMMIFLSIVWIYLVISMLYRIIPNKRIPYGARKHFKGHLISNLATADTNKGIVNIIFAWLIFNAAVFYGLFLLDLLVIEVAVIIMLMYSIFDIVFILFFCPFQKIFMKNKCCAECRIYNWDYIMMCTPLILFPSIYSVSLIFVAIVVLLRWEFAMWKIKDLSLKCSKCEDKLCKFKKR